MKTALNLEQTRKMFIYVSEKVIENEPVLTKIDQKIGDGDHGLGMSVGFSRVKSNLEKNSFSTINELFKSISMSLLESMGGASGVIFGTMFMGGLKVLDETYELNIKTLSTYFRESLNSIKKRGKAELGDKTMIDALEPAVMSLEESYNNNRDLISAIKLAAGKAEDGVEKTKSYAAKFGRAKLYGEKSIGYQDAGATSVWIIFDSMREWIRKESMNNFV